jgi:septal ring factor EnvC (AmiA/AmiB activator)
MIDDKQIEAEYSQLKVDIAVLKTKSDQTNTALKSIVYSISELENRVRKLERTTYMLLGGLIILQLLPMLANIVEVIRI